MKPLKIRLETGRKFVHYHALLLWRTRAFWLRGLLCWMVGSAFLLNDEHSNFDLRLQMRGPLPASPEILLVDISDHGWDPMDSRTRNILRSIKEVPNSPDRFFWNLHAWEELLAHLLDHDPAAVGITLFLGESALVPRLSPQARALFEDPRVIWGAEMDPDGRVLVPVFASTYNQNVGIRTLPADDDGVVRRFTSSRLQIPHLAVRLAELAKPEDSSLENQERHKSSLINYTSTKKSIPLIGFRQLLKGRYPADQIRGKLIVIGHLSSSLEQVQTPLGRLSRAEVIANITANVLNKTSISRGPMTLYVIMLALLMLGSIWMLSTYPQSVALVFFILLGTLWAAGSAWAFDTLHFWIPTLAPLVQLTLTYILFLSFQLTLNEQRTWRLQQKQKYMSEIEQLKTNFVSMMSHDLKTPIAKIQAICDRLIAIHPAGELSFDLKNLRSSSDELHRYIQSILQISKIEAKEFKISKEVTDINENIERAASRLQDLALQRQITLYLNLEPMFSIEADTTLLQEIVHNLIENAIKYTPPGGQVTVTSQEKDDNVVIVVEDTGPGIRSTEQKEIWGKFTRGRNLDGETKGTGLGLYLVKYFVELHGGRVFLDSELGRGTKVGFMIPVIEESPQSQKEVGG